MISFLKSFLNGVFIVNVRQVFLLRRNAGKHVLGSHLFVILTCSVLPRKSMLPFNTESPGQDAPGESPWKERSFRETAAGWNEHWLSSALGWQAGAAVKWAAAQWLYFQLLGPLQGHHIVPVLPASQHVAHPDLAQGWARGSCEACRASSIRPLVLGGFHSLSELPKHCLFELGYTSYATVLYDVESFCVRSTPFWIWVAFLNIRCQSGQLFFFQFNFIWFSLNDSELISDKLFKRGCSCTDSWCSLKGTASFLTFSFHFLPPV